MLRLVKKKKRERDTLKEVYTHICISPLRIDNTSFEPAYDNLYGKIASFHICLELFFFDNNHTTRGNKVGQE